MIDLSIDASKIASHHLATSVKTAERKKETSFVGATVSLFQ